MSELLNSYTLEFERPVRDLEQQIKELKEVAQRPDLDLSKEIKALEKKVTHLLKDIYTQLSPWERVQLSRHPNRPHAMDYINFLIEDFHALAGDRRFLEDSAIVAGFGKFKGQKVAVIGIEKGRKTKEKITHNFGMPRPEGYRKALRVMDMAGRFGIPIITMIDTPGAFPGVEAEERGQATAIAENLEKMFSIPSPIISAIIGEGGSGGALGIAIADSVMMQEYSIYSVISPESCASILWADPKKADIAANALQLGPLKAMELKIIDQIISEPAGGAHRDWELAAELLGQSIEQSLSEQVGKTIEQRISQRMEKFRIMGNESLLGV